MNDDTNNPDNVVPQETERPPRLTWPNGYPVYRRGEGAHEFTLPGVPTLLKPAKVTNADAVLLFGERKSGFSSFVRWWSEETARDGRLSVIIRRDLPASEGIRWSAPTGDYAISQQEQDELAKSLGAFFWSADPHHDVESMRETVRNVLDPIGLARARLLVIVQHLEFFGTEEQIRAMLTALRSIIESQRLQTSKPAPLRFMVTITSADLVDDRLETSGLLSVSNAYRLGYFGPTEIGHLANPEPSSGCRRLGLTSDQCERIREFTGGQPLLVARYLEALYTVRRQGQENAPTDSDLAAADDLLRRSPPSIVSQWQDHLRALLTRRPDLITPLEEYVTGKCLTKAMTGQYPPPIAERELFNSGWVGPDRFERWTIRSPLHRDWARVVLREQRKNRRQP